MREKILKVHKSNFKEKLGLLDRINHPPVKLKIDESRGIRPVKKTLKHMTYHYIHKMQPKKNLMRKLQLE